MVKVYLRDRSPKLVENWKKFFEGIQEVEVSEGGIFDGPTADAIISPANSFGFMDGGIDAVYANRFGNEVVRGLQNLIRSMPMGEIPVGNAVVFPIDDDKDFGYLVCAPTMRVPMNIAGTVNAYLAFKAALWMASEYGAVKSILCPGLGTGVGGMAPYICALQMRTAYGDTFLGERIQYQNLHAAYRDHVSMLPSDPSLR